MSQIEFNETYPREDFNPSNLFLAEWSELQSAPVPRSSVAAASRVLPDLAIVSDSTCDPAVKRSDDKANQHGNISSSSRKTDTRQTYSLSSILSSAAGLRRDAVEDLPDLAIEEQDRFLEKLCDAARNCSKSDFAVSILVQEAVSMVGFGAVLNALTVYANLQESA
ncbi:MAG: hypothetical protein K2X93_11480 [Candidatus Obscuribacterales bacterium]|nr:hypothetical protein [Candidatus Obscuribacterales bacterium]